jgi:hypothetical protein
MAAAALVLPLAVLRGGMLYLGLPYSFIELPLFDPRYTQHRGGPHRWVICC